MTSRSPPGSPLRGRFRWLRRLFRRIKFRHAKFKDGKHTKGRGDVELWQDDHPIANVDYPAYRWRGYSGLRPALPQDMTSAAPSASPRRHSGPPAPITPGAVRPHRYLTGRAAERIPEIIPERTRTDSASITTCIPTRRRNKPHSPEHTFYERRHSAELSHQSESAAALAQAHADAAYLEFLRQEFKNKYRYLTQDSSSVFEGEDTVPRQVLDLDSALQNPPRALDCVDTPELRPRRHTVDVTDIAGPTWPPTVTNTQMDVGDTAVPTWSPMMTNKQGAHGNKSSVHFSPTENEEGDIISDFQNVRNRFQAEELTKRKKHARRQRRRQRIRNQLYRKFAKPKGYKQLKESQEDKPEIEKLEKDFEEKIQPRIRTSPGHRSGRKQVTQKVVETTRRVSETTRETTRRVSESTRRMSETAKDGFQQMVGGLSRLQLEVPSTGSGAYRSFHQETPYTQPGIMVN